MFRQLLFPGKKPKEIIETGDDDSIDTDTDSGKKKDDGDVKVYFYSRFTKRNNNLKYATLGWELVSLIHYTRPTTLNYEATLHYVNWLQISLPLNNGSLNCCVCKPTVCSSHKMNDTDD